MHLLKTTLLGSSVFVSEGDISQYSVYCHSLGNIQKQLQGQTCFKLSESKQSFNSVSWTNAQESSLKDTFVLCFRRRFTAISEMLLFGWKNVFSHFHRKGLQTPANRHQFNSVSWTHTLKAVLLVCPVLVLEADISQYSVYCHSLGNIQKQLQGEMCFKLFESKQSFNSVSWTNAQQSSLEDTFVWCFRRRFTAIAEILGFGVKMRFLLLHRKGLQTPANTHEFNSVSLTHAWKAVLLGAPFWF